MPGRPGAPTVTLEELVVAADADAWTAAGFRVEEGTARVGRTRLRLAGSGGARGIAGWSLRDLPPAQDGGLPDLDGLSAEHAFEGAATAPDRHPNGALRLDHVVALTPDLDRTVAVLERAGLDLRRVRDAVLPGGGTRQAFFRLGEVILEAIEQPAPDGSRADPSGPARLWGLAFLTGDLDATVAVLRDRLGTPRDAVQPGRRIATVRREAGLGAPVAFITPEPGP